MRKSWLPLGVLAAVVLLALPKLVTSEYYIGLVILSFIYAAAVLGLNIVQGLSGQVSIAQGAFWGIGAYASMLLAKRLGLSFWAALPLSTIATAVSGLCLGIPSMKLGGRYLVLVSLGFASIVQMVLFQWIPVTGGPDGVGGIPAPAIGTVTLSTNQSYYYVVLAALAILVVASARIKNSRLGRAFMAIRDNEIAAEASGINTSRHKIIAFALSAAFGGVAGSLYAHWGHYVAPDTFSLDASILFLSMLVVGGSGSVEGAMLGALVLTLLPEVFRFSQVYYMALYSAALVAIVIFVPGGLWGFAHILGGKTAGRFARRKQTQPAQQGEG